MIITVDDIRNIRAIAYNIDAERVNVYIREAEELDIRRQIGTTLYERYNNSAELTTEEGIMLNGGDYTAECGGERHISGVKVALAYFAYARFVRNAQINVTPYGVVTKLGEDSEPTNYKAVAAIAQDAQNIGEALLAECLDYWRTVSGECCDKGQREKRKFIAIGR